MDFITEPEAYAAVLTIVSTAVDVRRRLPDNVLRHRPVRCACLEYEVVFDREFWTALGALARGYGDEAIVCLVIDPDPVEVTHRSFGYFGALSLPTSESPDRYLRALHDAPREGPGDSIRYAGMIFTLVSSSGGVVAWADHDIETAIVALYDVAGKAAPELPTSLPWMSTTQALDMMRPAFRNQEVPSTFRRAFLEHYGGCGG